MTFGCNLWGLTSEDNISKIKVLQRKSVRIMTIIPYNSYSNEIFMDLGLLKVRDFIFLSPLKLVDDFQNFRLPSDLMDLFKGASIKYFGPF